MMSRVSRDVANGSDFCTHVLRAKFSTSPDELTANGPALSEIRRLWLLGFCFRHLPAVAEALPVVHMSMQQAVPSTSFLSFFSLLSYCIDNIPSRESKSPKSTMPAG